MSAVASGGVFISYRRQETSGLTGRLYDRLAAHLGEDQVFMDVNAIALGVDFAEVVSKAVSTCQVQLVVIGPQWLTATDLDGRRRLDDPDDIVRLEIAAALERDIRVIPILVEGTKMPSSRELPDSLASLARRNALVLRHDSFRTDADRLLAAIEPLLRPPVGAIDPNTVVPLPSTVRVLRHDGDVNGVAFSPDGQLLATASTDHTARVWEVATGERRAPVAHDGVIYGVAFSPDGRLLATAGEGGARVWEVGSGQHHAKVTDDRLLWGVVFSPDGQLLATASADGSAQVWEVASGLHRVQVAHDAMVRSVVFSPDGQMLATASADMSARVWEVGSGQERARVTHSDYVRGVAFSSDGRLLATASTDQTARVWMLIR